MPLVSTGSSCFSSPHSRIVHTVLVQLCAVLPHLAPSLSRSHAANCTAECRLEDNVPACRQTSYITVTQKRQLTCIVSILANSSIWKVKHRYVLSLYDVVPSCHPFYICRWHQWLVKKTLVKKTLVNTIGAWPTQLQIHFCHSTHFPTSRLAHCRAFFIHVYTALYSQCISLDVPYTLQLRNCLSLDITFNCILATYSSISLLWLPCLKLCTVSPNAHTQQLHPFHWTVNQKLTSIVRLFTMLTLKHSS